MKPNLNEMCDSMWALDYWYFDPYFHLRVGYFFQRLQSDVLPLAWILQQLVLRLSK